MFFGVFLGFVQKKLTFTAMAFEFRPPPSALKQQANKKPPQDPSICPPLNQQKRKNSQDPVPHWCWSPTKALGAGERFRFEPEPAGGEGRVAEGVGFRFFPGFPVPETEVGRCLNGTGLTADTDTWRGRPNPKSGKKNGLGPPVQNFSSLLEAAEVEAHVFWPPLT